MDNHVPPPPEDGDGIFPEMISTYRSIRHLYHRFVLVWRLVIINFAWVSSVTPTSCQMPSKSRDSAALCSRTNCVVPHTVYQFFLQSSHSVPSCTAPEGHSKASLFLRTQLKFSKFILITHKKRMMLAFPRGVPGSVSGDLARLVAHEMFVLFHRVFTRVSKF